MLVLTLLIVVTVFSILYIFLGFHFANKKSKIGDLNAFSKHYLPIFTKHQGIDIKVENIVTIGTLYA